MSSLDSSCHNLLLCTQLRSLLLGSFSHIVRLCILWRILCLCSMTRNSDQNSPSRIGLLHKLGRSREVDKSLCADHHHHHHHHYVSNHNAQYQSEALAPQG